MEFPIRKTTRLASWDYSDAACYHVIMCSHARKPIFGCVVDRDPGAIDEPPARVELTDMGRCCRDAILAASEVYRRFSIDNFCIMPNHVHLLVTVSSGDGGTLASFVGFIKGTTARAIRKARPGFDIWQPRFYEHVIRGEADYETTWKYIDDNPAKWAEDRYWTDGS